MQPLSFSNALRGWATTLNSGAQFLGLKILGKMGPNQGSPVEAP